MSIINLEFNELMKQLFTENINIQEGWENQFLEKRRCSARMIAIRFNQQHVIDMLNKIEPRSKCNVIISKFRSRNDDFNRLIKIRSSSLFVFNDNENDHETYYKGGGNAYVRIYNSYAFLYGTQEDLIPRSAGIPTGDHGGYEKFDDHVKNVVDKSIIEIDEIIEEFGYDSIVYSCEHENNATIGSGIFDIDPEVKEYITNKLLSFANGTFRLSSNVLTEVKIDNKFNVV